jgi:hypothetical protein
MRKHHPVAPRYKKVLVSINYLQCSTDLRHQLVVVDTMDIWGEYLHQVHPRHHRLLGCSMVVQRPKTMLMML